MTEELKEFLSQTGSTVIEEEITYGGRLRQLLTLEVKDDFFCLWVGHAGGGKNDQAEIYLYLYNRQSRSIWFGNMKAENKIKGRSVSPLSVPYLCVLNSLKSYLGTLMLARPHDLRIFSVIDEVNNKEEDPFRSALRYSVKFWNG